MITDKQRRRGFVPPPVPIRGAFTHDNNNNNNNNNRNEKNDDDDDDENDTSSIEHEHLQTLNSPSIDSDEFYRRAFFTIHNTTVEVELDKNTLTWRNLSASDVTETIHRKKSPKDNQGESIHLGDVYAISPIPIQGSWPINVNESVAGTTVTTANSIAGSRTFFSSSSSSNVPLRGFQLHTCQTTLNNILQELLVIFQSNSSALIDEWYQMLAKKISKMRPTRHILTICNPYSGARHSRHTYGTKVKPMLEQAQYKATYIEIDDSYSADEALADLDVDFDSIDGLVIVGGDGSVINVINALIRYIGKENRMRLNIDDDLPAIPFPICIVAEGTTNMICHSFQGNTDTHTPILHLLFNNRMKIDMSAIFDLNDQFVSANFSAGAGYPATVLKYFPRFNLHSPKTIIKKSFSKAASKKNLRPMRIDIRYVPANQTVFASDRCFRGCPICTPESPEKSDDQVKVFDQSHLRDLNKKKVRRENSSKDLTKNWKTIEDEFVQVAVLTNACLWSFAPQGLSKNGHLADGVLDLILIRPTNRKEFLRYVKRNGNSKDQFDLPFVELIRVREVEITLKYLTDESMINAETQLDDSSNSDVSSNDDLSDIENKTSIHRTHQPHPPSAPISEDSRRHRRPHHRISEQTTTTGKKTRPSQSETDVESPTIDPLGSTTSLRRSGIFQNLKSKSEKFSLPRPFSSRTKDQDDDKSSKKLQRTPSKSSLRPSRSLLSLFTGGHSSSSTTATAAAEKGTTASVNLSRKDSTSRRPSIISRSSSFDNGKLETMKATSELKRQECLWNLDFTPSDSSTIRLKCFYRYLTVFGLGIDPDPHPREIKYSCFGRMG